MSDRDRLIELINGKIRTMKFQNSDHWFDFQQKCEEIADYLLANGVIVPPCKVGQTVYYISFGKVYKGKCHAITLKPTLQIHLYDYDGDNASISADRVFPSREEAEQALKEREGNERKSDV